jgi:hypothetical protein
MKYQNATLQQLYQIIKNEECDSVIKEAAFTELQKRYLEVIA